MNRQERLAIIEDVKGECKKEVYKNDLEQNVDVHLSNKKHPWKMPKSRPVGITTELFHKIKNIAYMKKIKFSDVWKASCGILLNICDMILEGEERPVNSDWTSVQWANHHKNLINKLTKTSKIVKITKEFNMDDDFENLKFG